MGLSEVSHFALEAKLDAIRVEMKIARLGLDVIAPHGSKYEIPPTRELDPPILGKWVLYHIEFRMGFEVMAPHGARYEILTTRALDRPSWGKWVLYHIEFRMGFEVMAPHEARYEMLTTRALDPPIMGKVGTISYRIPYGIRGDGSARS